MVNWFRGESMVWNPCKTIGIIMIEKQIRLNVQYVQCASHCPHHSRVIFDLCGIN